MRKCSYDNTQICRGIQVDITDRTMCCVELDEIKVETVSEIISVLDDIHDAYSTHTNNNSLFIRGLRQISYLTNILPTETVDQNEIMVILKDLLNEYREVDIDSKLLTSDKFKKLLSTIKSWLIVDYLHENNLVETNFLANLLNLSTEIKNIINPLEEDDLDDIFDF